jgi:hypothetical protein
MIRKLPKPTGPNYTVIFRKDHFEKVVIDWPNVERRARLAAMKKSVLSLSESEIAALALMNVSGREL